MYLSRIDAPRSEPFLVDWMTFRTGTFHIFSFSPPKDFTKSVFQKAWLQNVFTGREENVLVCPGGGAVKSCPSLWGESWKRRKDNFHFIGQELCKTQSFYKHQHTFSWPGPRSLRIKQALDPHEGHQWRWEWLFGCWDRRILHRSGAG